MGAVSRIPTFVLFQNLFKHPKNFPYVSPPRFGAGQTQHFRKLTLRIHPSPLLPSGFDTQIREPHINRWLAVIIIPGIVSSWVTTVYMP